MIQNTDYFFHTWELQFPEKALPRFIEYEAKCLLAIDKILSCKMPDESSSHVLSEPKEGKKPWKKKPAKQQITLSTASNILQIPIWQIICTKPR